MSTRRASDDRFHQERFCSSPELDGDAINALIAAKRIGLVQDRGARELLWFIQWRSLASNGLQQLCKELQTMFPDRYGTTAALQRFFASKRHTPTLEELRAIRDASHHLTSDCFSVRYNDGGNDDDDDEPAPQPFRPELSPRAEADEHRDAAADAANEELANHLRRCCVDPSTHITESPWYFINLPGALTELRALSIAKAKSRLADTLVAREINGALDFWAARRRMVLIEGVAGIGRTETLRAWCDAQAGLVRYVEVPSSADDRSFYVSIARELGVARGMSFSGQQIKLRVEETLRASGLMLALDESQYLWGNALRPRKTPDRILWIKTTFDAGTPIALIAHSDFSKGQEHFVKRTLWTEEQFARRVDRRCVLPSRHSTEDLIAIAKAHLPSGDERSWKLLAAFAVAPVNAATAYTSVLAKDTAGAARAINGPSGIRSVLENARYRAQQQGRSEASFADIEAALRNEHGFLQSPPPPARQRDATPPVRLPGKRPGTSSAMPLQRDRSATADLLPAADWPRGGKAPRATILESAG
jgi:hypothetical protein